MDYTDIEGSVHRKPLLRSFRRKWHQVPRYLRFYFIIAFVFAITLVSSYFYIFGNDINNNELKIPRNEPPKYAEKVVKNTEKSDDGAKNHFDIPKPFFDTDTNNLPKESSILLNASEFKQASQKQNEIQKRIQDAILHSWNGYRKYSWGYDNLNPLLQHGENSFQIGLTILDSLDTLLIAGLEDEYHEGLDWIANKLSFEVNKNLNCFEVTIRALAGLLSAYHLTSDKILLEKSTDLGDRLIHCFDSNSKVPFSDVNLKTRVPIALGSNHDSSLAEVATMQIEFRDLSHETKNDEYESKSFATSRHIHELVEKRKDPLLPMLINPFSGQPSPSTITLGARGDSYYEYLYKQYLQTGIEFLLKDYIEAIDAIHRKLMKTTTGHLNLTYIGEVNPGSTYQTVFPKMDHLVCFLSGTLALGYYHEHKKTENYRGYPMNVDNSVFGEHLKIGEDLARTCHYMYNLTATGLSPEIAFFQDSDSNEELYIKPRDAHNLLRPEFVESLFFLYHITGKEIYREWGLQIFNAFETYSKVKTGGYTSLGDVRNLRNLKPKDKMETFWIAETLKYLYLLFMDDRNIIDKILNNYVFNTEGHLLPRRVI